MSKSILAKAAVIACSAITLGALSITAAAEVTKYDAVKDADKYSDLTLATDKTNIIAGRVECDPGDVVMFPIYVTNNTAGFAATGLKLTYDANLTLDKDADGNPVGELGDVAKDLMPVFADNSEEGKDPCAGVGTIGMMKNATGDGEAFLVEFTVPKNATPGTTYPMALTIKDWKDKSTKAVDAVAFDGWIKIKGAAEETTTTAPATTTVPATTTTKAPDTTTKAPTTTTAPIVTTTTAPATTKAPDTTPAPATTTLDGTTTTADTTSGESTTTSTTKKGSSGGSSSGSSNTSATKTGDAGVGVAAAALLLAAGTAVVATKKKKD